MFEEARSNVRRTWLLIAAFVLVVTGAAYGFGYLLDPLAAPAALVVALGISLVGAYAAYAGGDRVVLAVSRARAVTHEQEPRLHNLVEGLSIAAGMPKPRVYVVEDPAPNAFATGRDPAHGSLAVTRGLLEKMNRVELEGVVGHELSHIKNRDTRVLLIAATLVGAVVLISDWTLRGLFWGFGGGRRRAGRQGEAAMVFFLIGLALSVLMPFMALAMQAAVSRRREQLADLTAVQLTRYPPGLIGALRKLLDDQTVVHTASRATAALWIESPLQRERGFFGWMNRLFDTHPPLEERIRVLEEL
jgi:heat shock protein HtpX